MDLYQQALSRADGHAHLSPRRKIKRPKYEKNKLAEVERHSGGVRVQTLVYMRKSMLGG